ncbi:MAG TPA: T9SS type A sorting domain-containing protein, partial [Saprospiraceae bacterium]|nr:T9SS type A sorting domain-containing protein [Saprospiraceae bacterium]
DGNGGWFGIERFAILTSNSVSTLNPDAASLNMSLWPNPAKEQCTLMIPGQVITAANLMVINTLGQQVPVAVTQEGPDRLAIQTTNLTTGLYYVQVAVGDRLAVSKLQISAE